MILIGIHFYLSRDRHTEAFVVIACSSIGIAVDSTLYVAGVYQMTESAFWPPIPMWLILIWVGFSSTLRHGLRFLTGRRIVAVLTVSITAPIVYHAAERFGAVLYPIGVVKTSLLISGSWVLMILCFVHIIRRTDKLSMRS